MDNFKNPLRFFDTLLRKNNVLSILAYHQSEDEQGINIYGEIIVNRIYKEASIIIQFLKDEIFDSNIECEQQYFYNKFCSQLILLSQKCKSMLETQLMLFKEYGLIRDKLIAYVNLEHIYQSLSEIRDELLFSWAYFSKEDQSISDLFNDVFPESEPKFSFKSDVEYMNRLNEIRIRGVNKPKPNAPSFIGTEITELIYDINSESDEYSKCHKIIWEGTPKDFVNSFSNVVEKKWIHSKKDARTERVKLLHEAFLIITEDNEPIELSTLQGYFSKCARGDTF